MTSVYVEGRDKPPQIHGPSISVSAEKRSETHMMGPPVNPKVHMDKHKTATWIGSDHQSHLQNNPYIQYSFVDQKPANKTLNNFVSAFNQWSKKADITSRNIWHNCPSLSEAACGKISLTAKAFNEGGFESLFKQSFDTYRNEKLKKWFACYLSTATGPVSGTLFLSTAHVAFCSDRPLLCKSTSGQGIYSYYKFCAVNMHFDYPSHRDLAAKNDKLIYHYFHYDDKLKLRLTQIMIPMASIGKVNPVIVKENPPEKYIQIVTIDGHDFWFMGFVSFEKATHHLFKNTPHAHTYGSK